MRRGSHFHRADRKRIICELLLVMPHTNVHDGDKTAELRAG
jgi:hypothetical protein